MGSKPTTPVEPPRTAHRSGPYPRGEGLTDLTRWPAEPASPQLDQEKLAKALGDMCSRLSNRERNRYAGWIAQYATEFQVDAFLLAALMYDQSRCRAGHTKGEALGLTGLNFSMHRRML